MSEEANPAKTQRTHNAESSTTYVSHVRRSKRLGDHEITLVYDQKYHPMDDTTRPANAMKRRKVHGIATVNGHEESDECDESNYDDSVRIDEYEWEEDSSRKIGRRQTSFGARHSTRIYMRQPVFHRNKIHPHDQQLHEAGTCDRRPKDLPNSIADCNVEGGLTRVGQEGEAEAESSFIFSSHAKRPQRSCHEETAFWNRPKTYSGLAKLPHMSVDDYVVIYIQAWEMLDSTRKEMDYEGRAKSYALAWETFRAQFQDDSVDSLTTTNHKDVAKEAASLQLEQFKSFDRMHPDHRGLQTRPLFSTEPRSMYDDPNISMHSQEPTSFDGVSAKRRPKGSLATDKSLTHAQTSKADEHYRQLPSQNAKSALISTVITNATARLSSLPPIQVRKAKKRDTSFTIHEDEPNSYWQKLARLAGPVLTSDSSPRLTGYTHIHGALNSNGSSHSPLNFPHLPGWRTPLWET